MQLRHWKLYIVLVQTVSSLVEQEFEVMTNFGTSSELASNIVGIMTNCRRNHSAHFPLSNGFCYPQVHDHYDFVFHGNQMEICHLQHF